ncbi:hypothetical protein PoB_003599500 [Plakobranchus ocellatus]|uniref:Uncharacterized protein n=1 Tax=Plakobranchus ocellatus TaxID=259542 RepID=A0AAV4AMP7_9GAST|nr:hypothetical protein PoB_003599500 [Plakobranchus ocellatus]
MSCDQRFLGVFFVEPALPDHLLVRSDLVALVEPDMQWRQVRTHLSDVIDRFLATCDRVREYASPQYGDLRLSDPRLPDQGASGGARTRDRRLPADLRAGWLSHCTTDAQI